MTVLYYIVMILSAAAAIAPQLWVGIYGSLQKKEDLKAPMSVLLLIRVVGAAVLIAATYYWHEQGAVL